MGAVHGPANLSGTTRGAIFDLDGTLVQTEQLKGEAHAAAVSQLGGHAPASLYRSLMGRSHAETQRAFLSAAGIDGDPETYTRIYRAKYKDLLRTRLELTPGARPLLTELEKRGYKLGLVSSSQAWMIEDVLSRTGLAGSFDVIVSANDVAKQKPEPDAYLLALTRLEIPPSAAIVLEDSETGVEAAARAGIPVIALRTALNKNHNLNRAAAVIDSFIETAHVIQSIEGLLAKSSMRTVSP